MIKERLTIIVVFMSLSFPCSSQMRERVNGEYEIGMPHFMENLQLYDIAYDNSEVVIPADTFKSFILGLKKKIGYIRKHAEIMETNSFYCRGCGL